MQTRAARATDCHHGSRVDGNNNNKTGEEMSEIGDPITVEIEEMFAKPHEGVWVRAVKPTPKRKPARALPRLRESLAEFPMYSLTSFELFFLGGDIGDCPSCKASWVDNVQQHSENCEYTAWLDYMDRYEDDDRW